MMSPAEIEKYTNLEDKYLSSIFMIDCAANKIDHVIFIIEKRTKKLSNETIKRGFFTALGSKKSDVVEYLLEKENLNTQSYLQLPDTIVDACRYGNVDAVKYFLTSEKLTTHADIHVCDDAAFEKAYRNAVLDVNPGNTADLENVLNYLIVDYGIKKTPEIKKILKAYDELPLAMSFINLFKKRDLNKKLNKSLTGKESTANRVKL